MSSNQRLGRSLRGKKHTNVSSPSVLSVPVSTRPMSARGIRRHSTEPETITEQQKLSKLPPLKHAPTPHKTSIITIPPPNNESTHTSLDTSKDFSSMRNLKLYAQNMEDTLKHMTDLNEQQSQTMEQMKQSMEKEVSLNKTLNQKIQQMEADMEYLTQENKKLRLTIQQIESDMNQTHKDNEILTLRMQQTKEKMERAQEEFSNQYATLDSKIKELVQDNTTLLEKFEQEIQAHIQTNEHQTKMMRDNSELMMKLKSLKEQMEQEIQHVQEALSKKHQLNEQLKEQCEHLLAENQILTNDNTRLYEYNKNIRNDRTRVIAERKTRERAFAKEIEKLKDRVK